MKEIITKVRGNHVTSQNPEVNYEALEKYGRDLVEEVRQGKMDPIMAGMKKFVTQFNLKS